MKKKIFRWAKVLILIYCTIGIAFYYLQDKLLLHPEPIARDAKYNFSQPYNEVNLTYNKETNLNIIQFKSTDSTLRGADSVVTSSQGKDSATTNAHRPDSSWLSSHSGLSKTHDSSGSRGVVLYFHGNKGNISRAARHAPDFTNTGYEVWMMDYPGFGKSTGTFNEQKLYDYALQLYKLARSRYRPSQIIIYGKSLGTGIAIQLASVRDCRRLILECPYYSMTSLVRHYMPIYPVSSLLHYHFPSYEYLPAVTAPISIFHGTSDGLIPISNAERLKPLLKTGDEFIPIEGAGHNDIAEFPMFHQKLDSLLIH
jgi:uncharacterized protein